MQVLSEKIPDDTKATFRPYEQAQQVHTQQHVHCFLLALIPCVHWHTVNHMFSTCCF